MRADPRSRDRDQPRVMRSQHRVTVSVQQDPQAPRVAAVDLGPGGECEAVRRPVGTLAEPDPGPGDGQRLAVAWATAQVGLDHAAQVGKVRAQVADQPQRRVDPGVVLHVDRDGGAGRLGGGADPADVLRRGLLAVLGQPEPDRGRLDRDLGAPASGEACPGEQLEQGDVLGRDRGGLLGVDSVLAEVVDRDRQALAEQALGHRQRFCGVVTRHEPLDHVPGQRRGRDHPADPLAGRRGQQYSAQHRSAPPRSTSRRARSSCRHRLLRPSVFA